MTHGQRHFSSYAEEICSALTRFPEREAVVRGEQRFTAGQLRDLVFRMARVFETRGLGPGKTVALLGGNLPQLLAARYAAHLLGCRVVHLYARLSVAAQAVIVRDVETGVLVVDPRVAGRAGELAARSGVPDILTLGPAAVGEDLLELAACRSAGTFPGRARPQDICVIQYTGGTTGRPKGVCTTFAQEAARGERPRVPDVARRLLVCTTLAHAAGRLTDRTLAAGGSVVLLEDFEPAEVLTAIERERISWLFLLPPLLSRLLDHPDCGRRDTSTLTTLLYGGCVASPGRISEALSRIGPVLSQGYGQMEAGGISQLTTEDHDPQRPERLRSAGRPLPGVRVAIRDTAGNDVPAGEAGEICVRSDTVMQGYWKQPELTAEVLRDGWLHTGDLGRLDADGYLTVLDRLRDVVIMVGGKFHTSELEDVLESHPGVRQSAVFGIPDTDGVDQVHAVVVPTPDGTVDERQLRELARTELGEIYDAIRITFTTQLPLTETGKPDKKLLRQHSSRTPPNCGADSCA
ncbi:AMP-binding protein [Streptomyces millisiae]|uniref:AMP-binding protein n=1 Tax=Streptomyces millisiae TaxID=3075542 RepID=A0ABU2LX15_9ACTN|nr:AMP-binding protein [Streptomyces sp. DSM 44918]MDT0322094.1 AMP-binding protein [Streptomyces sp. DSM 44918]